MKRPPLEEAVFKNTYPLFKAMSTVDLVCERAAQAEGTPMRALFDALIENRQQVAEWRSVPRCEHRAGYQDACGEPATHRVEYESYTSHRYTVRELRCAAHSRGSHFDVCRPLKEISK